MISKEDIISTLYERNQSNGAFILDTEEFSKWKKQKSSNFEKLTNFISQKLDSNSKEEFDNMCSSLSRKFIQSWFPRWLKHIPYVLISIILYIIV